MQIEMDRVDRIIYNDEYRRLMETVRNKETDRIFCRHGLEHCLDVARIAYIMNIEQGYAIDREIIYAAALLHDVGRADPEDTGRKHHELSVEYAGRILEQCGFSTQENAQICDAIGSHNTDGSEREGLAYVLYKADKLSRNCFDCEASDQCYWLESARNTGIKY